MIEDMTIRKLGRKTQQDYIQIIKKLAAFLGRSPDTATFEDLRIIRKHAEISGFPATKVTEVKKMIDPTTAAA
jgi:integrase/recombinase XerD